MVIQIKLKQKYRMVQRAKKTPYRPRTGPHCCCNHKKGRCCAKGAKRYNRSGG